LRVGEHNYGKFSAKEEALKHKMRAMAVLFARLKSCFGKLAQKLK
jgi:hypothetical protein